MVGPLSNRWQVREVVLMIANQMQNLRVTERGIAPNGLRPLEPHTRASGLDHLCQLACQLISLLARPKWEMPPVGAENIADRVIEDRVAKMRLAYVLPKCMVAIRTYFWMPPSDWHPFLSFTPVSGVFRQLAFQPPRMASRSCPSSLCSLAWPLPAGPQDLRGLAAIHTAEISAEAGQAQITAKPSD
jgi:hypothetical protein